MKNRNKIKTGNYGAHCCPQNCFIQTHNKGVLEGIMKKSVQDIAENYHDKHCDLCKLYSNLRHTYFASCYFLKSGHMNSSLGHSPYLQQSQFCNLN